MATHVAAGFPSPADDYVDEELNIHDWLVQHPAATFFMRVSGNALATHHIMDGDTLVVDRSLTPHGNDIVVVEEQGELVVQEWKAFSHTETTEEDIVVWGVVCGVVRKL